MKLIVNADDFGLTRGVNLGIVEAFRQGIVRSTTIMAGMDAVTHAAELAKQNPGLKTGLHFRLTVGKPVADDVPSLLDDDGLLQPQSQFWDNRSMVADEIERELRAQIQSCLNLGIQLSHIDGHHHCHSHELVYPVACRLAEEFGLPLRPCLKPSQYNNYTLAFSDAFYGNELTQQDFLAIIEQFQGKTDYLEVMCHPALVDEALLQASGYALPRTRELAILTDPTLVESLKGMDIEITDYTRLS